MKTENRCFWIDALKAICMICVYIYHTGFYYGIDYNRFVFIIAPFYVNGFFFISGYLLFKSYLKKDRYLKNDYFKSVKNILFKLVIPTILFSVIAYIPKHGTITNASHFMIYTIGGTAFWFTSALAVSQTLITSLFLSNRKNIWTFTLLSAALLVLINLFGDVRSKQAEEYAPWFWQTGMLYMFIMCLGGIYYRYETLIFKFINNSYVALSLLLAYIGVLQTSLHYPTYYFGLSGRNNITGIFGTVLSILLLMYISNRIRKKPIIEFIGKNSIIFYFLSCFAPIAVSAIANYLIAEKNYVIYVCVTFAAITVSYITTYIITRYFPFILDLRNLRIRKTNNDKDICPLKK